MEQVARAAGIADTYADYDASPTRDVEVGSGFGGRSPYSQRPGSVSRVSLPLSHRRSFSTTGGRSTTEHRSTTERRKSESGRSATSRQQQQRRRQRRHDTPIGTALTTAEPDRPQPDDNDDDEDAANEIPWGPEHPCFPHPNPHVPLASPLFAATRIIRIKRDWMPAGDVAPAFTTLYPEILDWFPCLAEDAFKALVRRVNAQLLAALSPLAAPSWADALLGLATGWLWDDAGLARSKKALRALEADLERWNRDEGAPHGVAIIPLRRTAYLSLDIQIPDPKIVSAADEADDEGAAATTAAATTAPPTETGDGASDVDSRAATASASGRGSALAHRDGGRAGGATSPRPPPPPPQPVVPPIPHEFLQESAALQITMEGFRDSRDSRDSA